MLPDGQLFVATRPANSNEKPWKMEVITVSNLPKNSIGAYVVAMGQDLNGEIYVMVNGSSQVIGKTGKVYKIVSN